MSTIPTKRIDDALKKRFVMAGETQLYTDLVVANHVRVSKRLSECNNEQVYELVAAYMQAEEKAKTGTTYKKQSNFNWDKLSSTDKIKEVFG